MPRRITQLTPEQTDRMSSFADEWIERGHRTTPLTEEEWRVWEQGARKCYEYAGIPWPGVVVRVGSPIVGAFAAPLASLAIARLKHGAVDGAVGGAVRGAVDDAVDGAVRGAVGGAVRDAVRDAVDGAVDDAVDGAVRGAVGGAVRDAVRGAVDDAVDGAVRGAVQRENRQALQRLWYHRWGGTIWAGWWQSYINYFRDVAELDLDGDLWDRSRAWDAANSGGWWWPFRDFVMVCDVPTEIHLEQVRPRGWGSHRLHREDGPAVAWADGWGVYAWHGTIVPADLIEDGWSIERILAERNTEVRRCAVERMGWPEFLRQADATLIAETPDPGNDPHTLRMYEIPDALQSSFSEPARIVLCTNGSPERDGTRHQFGIVVRKQFNDPIAGMADTYGVPAHMYAQLQARR